MSGWFRVYAELVDDPKFIKLGPDLRNALLMMWCVAAGNNGRLLSLEDMAIKFRMSEDRTRKLLEKLRRLNWIDDDETGSEPHNWSVRQYKSDVSTDRVKRFRERQRNVSETPPDTEQNRTDSETEKKEAAAVAAPDVRTTLFREGLSELRRISGLPEGRARGLVGKWLRDAGDNAAVVHRAILDAVANRVAEPVAWINRSLNPTQEQEEKNARRSASDRARANLRAYAQSDGDVCGQVLALLPERHSNG